MTGFSRNTPILAMVRLILTIFVLCQVSAVVYAKPGDACAYVTAADEGINTGLSKVLEVVAATAPGEAIPGHIAFRFTQDPRFDTSVLTEARKDFPAWEIAFEFLYSDERYNQSSYDEFPGRSVTTRTEVHWSIAEPRLKEINQLHRVYVTWDPLGRNAINHLIANKMPLLGLSDVPLNIDSLVMSQAFFGFHDLVIHSMTAQELIANLNDSFASRYSEIHQRLKNESENKADFFAFAYNYFYWEQRMVPAGILQAIKDGEVNTAADLREAMLKLDNRYQFTFENEDLVNFEIKDLEGTPSNSSISRFLKPNDLRDNLHPNIVNQLTGKRRADAEVITPYVNSSFLLFFQEFYQHYAEVLSE